MMCSRLPPESILLRWFNFHLKAAGSARTVTNFSGDVMVTIAIKVQLI